MKYLKKFESINKYKEGDYVYVKCGSPYDNYAKIIGVNSFDRTLPYYDEKKIQYKIEVFDLDKDKLEILHNIDTEIKRKLTPKEINQFEVKNNIKKFNI